MTPFDFDSLTYFTEPGFVSDNQTQRLCYESSKRNETDFFLDIIILDLVL
jgi:hypothetical protein